MRNSWTIWALRKPDKEQILAAEMCFSRETAGYTLIDRKRNEDIQRELKVTPILKNIFGSILEELTRACRTDGFEPLPKNGLAVYIDGGVPKRKTAKETGR